MWTEVAKLTASDGEPLDGFGHSIALENNTLVAGAWRDQVDGVSTGSAYIFEEVDGTWVEKAKITPSDGAQFDKFGISVDIFGSTIVVGSKEDDDRKCRG